MTNLYLKALDDGTGVRLYPANYSILSKLNDRWMVDIDSAVPAHVASIIFNAFHGLRCSSYLTGERLAQYINTFLTGERLVIRSGATISDNMMQPLCNIETSRTVPVLDHGKCNELGIESLINSIGLLNTNDVFNSCHYDAAGGKHGQVLVYINDLLKYRVNCEVL